MRALQHTMTEYPQRGSLDSAGRRSFLRAGIMAGLSVPFLSACNTMQTRDLICVLGWVPDVEYADLWVAREKGYFDREGLHLKIWPGGPNAPQPVVEVAARQAHLGDAEWLPLLDAVLRGNDYVIIGSIFPVHPAGLISLPRRPVRNVGELSGARFLVQGPSERTTIEATFKLNRLAPDYQLIPVGFSPEALLDGAGDAYYCFVTNQPLILENMGMRNGIDFYVTPIGRFGYKVPSTLIFTQRETLRARRPELVSFLKGRMQGMIENKKDPAYAASIVINKYGADLGLDLQQETRTNVLQMPLYQAPGSRGPYWISNDDLMQHMYPAAYASGRSNLPEPSRLMDMTLLEDVYRQLSI
jgi:ABC-type nitrate/sulfonate/bicarbonate transport system substrate-binding protein